MIAAAKGYAAILVVPGGLRRTSRRGHGRPSARTVVRTPADARGCAARSRKPKKSPLRRPDAYVPQQVHAIPATRELTTRRRGRKSTSSATGRSTRGSRRRLDRHVRRSALAFSARETRVSCGSRWSRRVRSSKGGRPGQHDVEGHRPVLLSRNPRPEPDRRLRHDFRRRGVRDVPASSRANGGTPRRRLLGRGRRGRAASRAPARPGKTVVTLFPDGAERYPDQGIFGARS